MFADPELTLGLPPAVTAATGMDALTHCIETYLSPAYHPLCDGIALEGAAHRGARAAHRGARAAATSQARSDMMMASMMGAIAFQKDLGAVHSLRARARHGVRPAPRPGQRLMIDTVLRFNLDAAPAKFAELAHVVGRRPAAATASSPGCAS